MDSTECLYQLKDEATILPQTGIESEPKMNLDESIRPLILKSSEAPHTGIKRPRTSDDTIQFNMNKGASIIYTPFEIRSIDMV